jgi:hypothetical protein
MQLVKTLPHLGGVPEILVFYCSSCKQAETKVQEQKAGNLLLLGCKCPEGRPDRAYALPNPQFRTIQVCPMDVPAAPVAG